MRVKVWRPIVNFEGIYEISDLGEIRRIKNGNILKGYIGPDGYKRVGLTVDCETKVF